MVTYPDLDAAPPSQPKAQSSARISASVVSVDRPAMTAEVAVADRTVTAKIVPQSRGVKAGDNVDVDWRVGQPTIVAIRTPRTAKTYSFGTVTPGTTTAATRPPSNVSVSVPSVVTSSAPAITQSVPSSFAAPGVSYEQAVFNGWNTRLNAFRTWAQQVAATLSALIETLEGDDGTGGVKAQAAALRSASTQLQSATNTQSTALDEHQKVLATVTKDTLAAEWMAQ